MPLQNNYLTNARRNKKDEFYTQYSDISNEVEKFKDSFLGKTVYCCCDNSTSNFPKYFRDNFEMLKLKGLYWSSIDDDMFFYDGTSIIKCNGNVDITTEEFKENLKKCDIVCTNPPFSLFVSFVNTLIKENIEFLIIGSQNAISCKTIFSYIMNNGLVTDYGFKGLEGFFFVPDIYTDFATAGKHKEGMIRVSGVIWYTTLKKTYSNPKIKLTQSYYNPDGSIRKDKYPVYDNFRKISGINEDCIEIKYVKDIPYDYYGYMGVPISFLGKYNEEQFEIIQLDHYGPLGNQDNIVNGKQCYRRIYIKPKSY